MDSTLSVQQAAAHFGVSEKTIRRRIAAGELPALKVPTAQGYEWRIALNGKAVHLDTHAVQLDSTYDQGTGQPGTLPSTGENLALLRALELADRLQQENAQLVQTNVQLAGQVGFLQAKLQGAQDQVRLLTAAAPQHGAEEPQPEQNVQNDQVRSPWWKRLFGGGDHT